MKEELARKYEELLRKDEEQVREREALIDDAAKSFMVDFEDTVAQASRIYPEMDFSQLGLGKIVEYGVGLHTKSTP